MEFSPVFSTTNIMAENLPKAFFWYVANANGGGTQKGKSWELMLGLSSEQTSVHWNEHLST